VVNFHQNIAIEEICGEMYYRYVIVNSLWNASNRNFETTSFNFLKRFKQIATRISTNGMMIDWLSMCPCAKVTIHTSIQENNNCAYFKNYSCTPLSTITTDYINLNKARIRSICMQCLSLAKESSQWQETTTTTTTTTTKHFSPKQVGVG
jgi:hypothetical protein